LLCFCISRYKPDSLGGLTVQWAKCASDVAETAGIGYAKSAAVQAKYDAAVNYAAGKSLPPPLREDYFTDDDDDEVRFQWTNRDTHALDTLGGTPRIGLSESGRGASKHSPPFYTAHRSRAFS